MGVVFTNVVDHINKRLYPLDEVPCSYGMVPSYYLENDLVPIYDPHPDEVGRGMYTIAHMIDMYFNKVPFTFIYEGDVFSVRDKLRLYMDTFEHVQLIDPDQQEFLNRANALYKELVISCQRLLNKYKGRQPTKVSLASVLAEMRR